VALEKSVFQVQHFWELVAAGLVFAKPAPLYPPRGCKKLRVNKSAPFFGHGGTTRARRMEGEDEEEERAEEEAMINGPWCCMKCIIPCRKSSCQVTLKVENSAKRRGQPTNNLRRVFLRAGKNFGDF